MHSDTYPAPLPQALGYVLAISVLSPLLTGHLPEPRTSPTCKAANKRPFNILSNPLPKFCKKCQTNNCHKIQNSCDSEDLRPSSTRAYAIFAQRNPSEFSFATTRGAQEACVDYSSCWAAGDVGMLGSLVGELVSLGHCRCDPVREIMGAPYIEQSTDEIGK